MSRHLSACRIWGMPILVGISSALGLLAALLGDGLWDVLSWVFLGIPVMLCLRYLLWPPSSSISRF